eukprot:3167759-Amphidinium_carterae.1
MRQLSSLLANWLKRKDTSSCVCQRQLGIEAHVDYYPRELVVAEPRLTTEGGVPVPSPEYKFHLSTNSRSQQWLTPTMTTLTLNRTTLLHSLPTKLRDNVYSSNDKDSPILRWNDFLVQFEDSIENWNDLTELEPVRRGPAFKQRLEGTICRLGP